MGDGTSVPGVQALSLVRVRAYLVDEEPASLIDAGLAGSSSRIGRALATHGRSFADITRVVCTHGHPDHAGGARELAAMGIEVLIHPADAEAMRTGWRAALRRPSRGRLFAAMTPELPDYTLIRGGVRKSLEMLGARLDRGFNVLLYPEGKLTLGGPLQPFKAGAGLIAVEGATPIVPVKLRIHQMSIIDRRRLGGRLRGDVEFVIGDPIWFDADTDHATATTRLEAAVAAL